MKYLINYIIHYYIDPGEFYTGYCSPYSRININSIPLKSLEFSRIDNYIEYNIYYNNFKKLKKNTYYYDLVYRIAYNKCSNLPNWRIIIYYNRYWNTTKINFNLKHLFIIINTNNLI
jgi:hypothetical protein